MSILKRMNSKILHILEIPLNSKINKKQKENGRMSYTNQKKAVIWIET